MKPSQNSLFKADTYVRTVFESDILGLVHMKCQHNLVSISANFRYTLDTRNVMDV
jgi:hypothetical protein